MPLFFKNPKTGKNIQYTSNIKKKSSFQKLVEDGTIKRAELFIQNFGEYLPYKLMGNSDLMKIFGIESTLKKPLTMTKLLASSNSAIYETDNPLYVVKISAEPNTNTIINEYRIANRSMKSSKYIVKIVEIGNLYLDDAPEFEWQYIVMERLDYTLNFKIDEMIYIDVIKFIYDILSIYLTFYQYSLAYADFKPENIMWSNKDKCWKVIDLESVVEFGIGPVPVHTPIFSPTIYIKKRDAHEIVICPNYDLESIGLCIYNILEKKLPWGKIEKIPDIITAKLNTSNLYKTPKNDLEWLANILYIVGRGECKKDIDYAKCVNIILYQLN